MKNKKEEINKFHTVIIGSGAAGLNCAIHLVEEGINPMQIAIITEKLGGGTSFNTGSDKQTYYKLSVIGQERDSPVDMADDFFAGGAMHGDIALIESTNSIREFFHLVQLGVPFPHDKYGGYVGYKTDNDPRQRATSIGPLTSQKMGECLLDKVSQKGIKIFDKHYAVKLITSQNTPQQVLGVICLKLDKIKGNKDFPEIDSLFSIFQANNIIMATGGPAILYKNSVYPKSQKGSLGLAIEAGCTLQNVTESQFGLASIQFRWNVSGSYQQVIPRYYSLDQDGKEYEFLNQYFPDFNHLSKAIFLKGYQWPFNPERIENLGSSLIDLAVYYESEILNRKVFMDFRSNPKNYHREALSDLASDYLEKSEAFAKTPIMRLKKLNEASITLYKNHNIDLFDEPLEIAVCNQHLNGGIKGNLWWETNISHLFAIGEVNGSHGVHRPGGAALNSGQVGGLRAAQRIGHVYDNELEIGKDLFIDRLKPTLNSFKSELKRTIHDSKNKEKVSPTKLLMEIQERMSKFGGIIRPKQDLQKEVQKVKNLFSNVIERIHITNPEDILTFYQVKDALLTQHLFLEAIYNYHKRKGSSRGSYLISRNNLDDSLGEKFISLPENLQNFQFIMSEQKMTNHIQEISIQKGKIHFNWVSVRQIPENLGWFEKTWKKFQNEEIYRRK